MNRLVAYNHRLQLALPGFIELFPQPVKLCLSNTPIELYETTLDTEEAFRRVSVGRKVGIASSQNLGGQLMLRARLATPQQSNVVAQS